MVDPSTPTLAAEGQERRRWTTGEFLRARRIGHAASIEQIEASANELLKAAAGNELSYSLGEIEAGAPLMLADAWALALALETDFEILGAIAAGDTSMEICRVCGCTYSDPCTDADGNGCSWADPACTICSTCKEGIPE